jgi:hypothetical protein
MHAVAVYTLMNQRMLLVELQGREETNKTRHEGPKGALLFLRAKTRVGKSRKQVPQRGTTLAFPYVESGNLYKATQSQLCVSILLYRSSPDFLPLYFLTVPLPF